MTHFFFPIFLLQSVIARGLLGEIADKYNYVPVFMNFSAQTSSMRSQEMIESKLEKKRKNILGILDFSHVSSCFFFLIA